eukprot:GEMP01027575.1.p1 GENE.GEMP01027575.1~~GEMP01027575.1.p1  ORF type:complete len:450 (+),score=93.58 GEMP01027575.1:44-1393(+)
MWEDVAEWLGEDVEIVDHDDLELNVWVSAMAPHRCLRMVLLENSKAEVVSMLIPVEERIVFANVHAVSKCKALRCAKLENFDCYASESAVASPLSKCPPCQWVISKSLEPLTQQSAIKLAVRVTAGHTVLISMADIIQCLRRQGVTNVLWCSPKRASEQAAASEVTAVVDVEPPAGLDLTIPAPASVHWVRGVHDPVVADFIGMKEYSSEDKVISEGGDTLKQLLSSIIDINVILLKESQFVKHREQIIASGKKCTVAVCDKRTLKEITTYKSVGPGTVLASAWRPSPKPLPFPDVGSTFKRLLALDGLVDAENVGSLLRSAACFGVDAVLLSQDCCDVWYRRCVRVSMGHVFKIPTFRVDLPGTLQQLRQDGFETYGAIVQDDTVPLGSIRRRKEPWCLVVGSEHFGISDAVRAECGTKVKIEMSPDVDSLNVGVAAAVLLHHFRFIL